MWPSAADRARWERHEVGARAAAVLRGLPQVEDAWVELRAEGSGEVATATVVMREGSADWAQVERAVRGMEGLSGVARIERVGTTVPRLSPGLRWAKVGPFRVDAGQAGLLRWSFVSVLLLLSVFAAAIFGGVGSLPGAVLGGFLVGIAENLFLLVANPGYKPAMPFLLLLGVLWLRPQGLLGEKSS